MRQRVIGAFVAAPVLLAAAVGLAGSAAADDAPPGTWEMPDVTGVVLEKADAVIREATALPGLKIKTLDYVNHQNQLNLTNWVVCAQSPKAAVLVPPERKSVTLYVKRPNQKSCT